MPFRIIGVAIVAVVTAACSSGSSGSSSPSGSSTGRSDPPDSTIGQLAPEPDDAGDVTSSTGRPLVIDGPARVELDRSDDDGVQADSVAPTGDDAQDTSVNAPPTAPDVATGTTPDGCAGLARGVSEFTLDAGGAERLVRVYVPERLAATPAPVVLDWHGLGGDGAGQAVYTGYETVAAEEGFVVVHPTGVPSTGDDRNSWELTNNDSDGRDDLAFADALIDTIVRGWCGDVARIYSTGFSNGGFFTAELICHRAERIAAAVSVAGLAHPPGCTPQRPVPYLAYHGTDDVVVPIDGGGISPLADDPFGANGLFDPPIRAEFGEFATAAGCAPEPVRSVETDDVTRYDYRGCDDGVPMTFFELTGSGHSWPGSPVAGGATDTLGYHTFDVDATRDAWDFFEQHSL